MLKQLVTSFFLLISCITFSQDRMTPELLWQLGRVTGLGISKDGKYAVYSVSTPNAEENRSSRKTYMIPVEGGVATEISNADSILADINISPDGMYKLSHKEVKLKKITGSDHYPDLVKSNVYIYDNLNYRHWDTWEDGKFDHVFVTPVNNPGGEKDIMSGEPYDSPQKPFGGDEDYIWSPDSRHIIYVTKKKYGKDYAVSTNTDLYEYDLMTGLTKNLTEKRVGYDIEPAFSKNGVLAWMSMRREGYEADKQDILASTGMGVANLTGHRDDIHAEGFRWN